MDSYLLKQIPINNEAQLPQITRDELNNNPYGIVKLIKKQENKPFLNYYEKPVPVISSGMKSVLEAIDPGAVGRPLGLADLDSRSQLIYWLLKLEVYKGSFDKTAVKLETACLPDEMIFAVLAGIVQHVIIRANLAESFLRNHFSDIVLEKCALITN